MPPGYQIIHRYLQYGRQRRQTSQPHRVVSVLDRRDLRNRNASTLGESFPRQAAIFAPYPQRMLSCMAALHHGPRQPLLIRLLHPGEVKDRRVKSVLEFLNLAGSLIHTFTPTSRTTS